MSLDSSPAIRRAKVTYGRARNPSRDIADTSLADISIMSSSNLCTSSPADEPPPSSDGLDASLFAEELDHEDKAESPPDATGRDKESQPRHRYEWQKRLEELDRSDDEEDESMMANSHRKKGQEVPLSNGDGGESTSPEDSSNVNTTHAAPSRQSFSYSSLTDLPISLVPSSRPSKRRLTVSPDSESEAEASSPQTSPPSLHHISTPQKQSSPTPPTSTEILPPRKGKASMTKIPSPRFDQQGNDSDEGGANYEGQRSKKPRKGKECVKPPTKKEYEETLKTSARMKASTTTEVRGQTKVLTLHKMFQVVGPSSGLNAAPSSDIEQFSSPGHFRPDAAPPPPFTPAPPAGPHRALGPLPSVCKQLDDLSDNDVELPDAADILNELKRQDTERKAEHTKAELLAERKRRALEGQKSSADESEDDLQVVSEDMHTAAREEGLERRRRKALGLESHPGKRMLLSNARKLVPKPPRSTAPSVALVEAAAGAFGAPPRKAKPGYDDQTKIDRESLSRYLYQAAKEDGQGIIKQKETDWRNAGGKVEESLSTLDDKGSLTRQLAVLVERGRQVGAGELDINEDGHATDESGAETEQEQDMLMDVAEPAPWDDVVRVASAADDDADEDESAPVPRRRQRGRPPAISDSDDENAARESSEENADNETDKENNAALMFDRGENKENTAIHFSPSPAQPSLQRSLSSARDGWGARSQHLQMILRGLRTLDDGSLQEDREPFRDISKDEEDPFTVGPQKLSFSLSRDSPASGGLALDLGSPLPDPEATLIGPGNSPLVAETAPIFGAGFSQLFDSGSAEAGPSFKPVKAFSQFVTPAKDVRGFGGLRKADNNPFSLSFNPGLQPALDVTDSVRKKADDIFEKEQDFMLEDQDQEEKDDADTEMFVNENGFLTQTRPSNPDIARLTSSAQSSRIGGSPSLLDSVLSRAADQRRPLGDLELDGEDGGIWSAARPGGRLKRRRSVSPELDGGRLSPSSVSPSPSPIKRRLEQTNAFQIMREAQMKPVKKAKLKKSDYVDGQAEESDEDDRFGFGGGKRQVEEEEEEDNEEELAKLHKEMVDDVEMDEATLNEEKVLEKRREHEEEADAAAEKVARDAIAGKLRAGRGHRGTGFEDDDEDASSDDDNAARRRKLAKRKRQLGREDDLNALGKDQAYQPFLKTYEDGLDDDDLDFAHLEREGDGANEGRCDELGHGEDEDEQEQEELTTTDLRKELQRVAQGQRIVNSVDQNDVSWAEDGHESDADERVQVKEVSNHRNKSDARFSKAGDWELEGRLRHRDDMSNSYSKHGDALSRGSGTSRSVGASAVTGHARAKRGDGSITGQRSSDSKGTRQSAKPITRAPSKLSAVSGRREHFAN